MKRTIRYQGVVLRGDCLLLIQHRHYDDGRAYWLIPGGGLEGEESEEECVIREMREETNLKVSVERLLLEYPTSKPGGIYERYKTYLCRVEEGEPQPGYEPEPEAAASYAIVAVGWFDLSRPETWDPLVQGDPFTYPFLQKVQAALGYPVAS